MSMEFSFYSKREELAFEILKAALQGGHAALQGGHDAATDVLVASSFEAADSFLRKAVEGSEK